MNKRMTAFEEWAEGLDWNYSPAEHTQLNLFNNDNKQETQDSLHLRGLHLPELYDDRDRQA